MMNKSSRDLIWKISDNLRSISLDSTDQKLYYSIIKLRIQKNILIDLVQKLETEESSNVDSCISS
jgi:hypothetical protein